MIFNQPPVLFPANGYTFDFYVGEIQNILASDPESATLTLSFLYVTYSTATPPTCVSVVGNQFKIVPN